MQSEADEWGVCGLDGEVPQGLPEALEEVTKIEITDLKSAAPSGADTCSAAADLWMAAWKKFEATDEFENALQWATRTHYEDGRPILDADREQHAKGAMWLAFTKGMQG